MSKVILLALSILVGSTIFAAPIERIIVKCPNNSNISLIVEPKTTIKSIKSQLELLLNIPADEQTIKLELNGRELDNSTSLENLFGNISFIMEPIKNENKLTKLDVKFEDGHIDTIDVKPTSTVSAIKEKLEAIEHIPSNQQVLYYNDKLLLNPKTIQNYGIPTKAFLSFEKAAGKKGDDLKYIQVISHIKKDNNEGKKILISVTGMTTTRMVRLKLENILRTKVQNGLRFNEQILSDSRTLSSYGIPDKALLHAY